MGGEGDYHAIAACACLSASGGALRTRFWNRCDLPNPLTPNPLPAGECWGEGSRVTHATER